MYRYQLLDTTPVSFTWPVDGTVQTVESVGADGTIVWVTNNSLFPLIHWEPTSPTPPVLPKAAAVDMAAMQAVLAVLEAERGGSGMTFQQAISYIVKVKKRLAPEEMAAFFALLREFKARQKTWAQVYEGALMLLQGHDDLVAMFATFLPHNAQSALRGYEQFHQLKRGSATIAQVASSSLGLDGWASSTQQPSGSVEGTSEGAGSSSSEPTVGQENVEVSAEAASNKRPRGDSEEDAALQRALLILKLRLCFS